MNEINFIPDWYSRGKSRRRSYLAQYIVLGSVFGVCAIWSFFSGMTLSNARAEADRQAQDATVSNTAVASEYNQIQDAIAQLSLKEQVLSKLDNKIDVAALLAEISFLLDENIVLSKIELQPESFSDKSKSINSMAVTIGRASANTKFSQEPVRCKVVLEGIATTAGAVASLISKLESSVYLRNIVPGVMKNKEIKDYTATEFEISSYLANYIEQSVEGR
jgi:hypothetical protein